MRTNLICASLILLTSACGIDQPMNAAPHQEADLTAGVTSAATLVNGLPYDWCTWLVDVGEKQFTPSDASIARVEAFTHKAIGKTKATIEYRVTGLDKTVQCGWHATVERPEIEILSIR